MLLFTERSLTRGPSFLFTARSWCIRQVCSQQSAKRSLTMDNFTMAPLPLVAAPKVVRTTGAGSADQSSFSLFKTGVLRYGHLRSTPVVVDGGLRTEWEPPTLRAALWVSTRPTWRLLDGLLPLHNESGRQCAVVVAVQDCVALIWKFASDAKLNRSQSPYRPSGCAGRCATPPCPT